VPGLPGWQTSAAVETYGRSTRILRFRYAHHNPSSRGGATEARTHRIRPLVYEQGVLEAHYESRTPQRFSRSLASESSLNSFRPGSYAAHRPIRAKQRARAPVVCIEAAQSIRGASQEPIVSEWKSSRPAKMVGKGPAAQLFGGSQTFPLAAGQYICFRGYTAVLSEPSGSCWAAFRFAAVSLPDFDFILQSLKSPISRRTCPCARR
jgi:hypothetical protein